MEEANEVNQQASEAEQPQSVDPNATQAEQAQIEPASEASAAPTKAKTLEDRVTDLETFVKQHVDQVVTAVNDHLEKHGEATRSLLERHGIREQPASIPEPEQESGEPIVSA